MRRTWEKAFADAKLREMYEVQQMSTRQIAEKAREVMEWDKPPHCTTVIQWLRGAGVSLRTKSEAKRLRFRDTEFRKENETRLKKLRETLKQSGYKPPARPLTPEERKKGACNSAAARLAEFVETTCRVCMRPVTRRTWMFRCESRRSKFIFCGKGHRAKFGRWMESLPPELKEVIAGDYDENGLPKEIIRRWRARAPRKATPNQEQPT